jgi:CDP-paratose synthetase
MSGSNHNILLTGGTGFLGSHLIKPLINSGFSVILLKRTSSDIRRIKEHIFQIKTYDIEKISLRDIFIENNIGMVIHCATDYGNKNTNNSHLIQANILLPVTLLELAKEFKATRFINTDTILDAGNNAYALSKKQFNDWFQLYRDALCCINIRAEQFYGPDDDETKFITSVIKKLRQNADKIELTNGEQERGFTFIDDLTNAFLTIINATSDFKPGFNNYDVGTREKIKIKELVMLIKQNMGNTTTQLVFGAVPYRKNELMNYQLNIDEVTKLGWSSKISLAEGLMKTIKSSS